MVTPTPPERVTTKNTPLPLANLKTLMSPETINLHGHLLLRLVQLRQQFLGPVLGPATRRVWLARGPSGWHDSRTRARMLAKRVLSPPGFGGLIASSIKNQRPKNTH
jgi:hypothetical protein